MEETLQNKFHKPRLTSLCRKLKPNPPFSKAESISFPESSKCPRLTAIWILLITSYNYKNNNDNVIQDYINVFFSAWTRVPKHLLCHIPNRYYYWLSVGMHPLFLSLPLLSYSVWPNQYSPHPPYLCPIWKKKSHKIYKCNLRWIKIPISYQTFFLFWKFFKGI